MLVRTAYLFAAVALIAGTASADELKLPPATMRPINFEKDIRPIFDRACFSCHGPKSQKSSFRLDQKNSALAGGDFGVAIVPGNSAQSPLIHRVAGVGEDKPMPPEGKRLTAEQIGVLRAWIEQGAKWPDDKSQVEAKHWAYQPLLSPSVPRITDSNWPVTPVDAFILAKLRSKHLNPSSPAEPRVLLRRLYFDLIGLPPTPEETAAFLADCHAATTKSAVRIPQSAIERVVDRLLASPHYGERWARHWLDVARYAETHGHDQDRPRPNAWPYRDYLIRSFNEDKPYARFVAEQIAGDVLFPNDPQATVALGFLAAGPWDESSLLNIVDDTVDKKIAQVLDRDDMLTAAMTTFVSSTVHCARCHNHKFDPITQKDYYSLQAVFAGVDKAERPFDPDPTISARRRELLARKAAIERLPKDALLAADVLRQVVAWEKSLGRRRSSWRVLQPESVATKNGTKLVQQPDGSYLATAKPLEKDTYTFAYRAIDRRITAIRLEVLCDSSLPMKGPGRQDNGNLHLSEFRILVGRDTDKPTPMKIRRATADFNQEGWTVRHAIDGNPTTAWGIYPNVGRPHHATFELEKPIDAAGGVALTIELDQLHGSHHLIGRPRLSFTEATDPHSLHALPDNITAILHTFPWVRTEVEMAELAKFVLNEKIERQLGDLPKPQLIYAATNDFKPEGNFKPARKPRPVHVLRRGDIHQPAEPAAPGALGCVPPLPSRFNLPDATNEGDRRAALANWLADAKNVLTWRSIVNRVWHYHFGKGLVDTPNDFGRMGSAPSHPELLDWLACWFRDHGGSMKKLHRLIVLSNAYRQTSSIADCGSRIADFKDNPPSVPRTPKSAIDTPKLSDNPQSAIGDPQSIDSDNRLLWRMNRTRLDAESVRDAVLQITGKLDRSMEGPSVKQFNMSPGIHVTPNVDYTNFNVDHPANNRRAVYRFVFRTLPDPFLEAMDCPDASQQAPVRTSSVTALQALAMLNDKFIVRQCEHLAERIEREAKTPEEQVRRLYLLTLHREPSAKETELLTNHAAKFGLPNVCRVVLNCNEFLFVP